jgi:hypothetical protein
LIYKFFPGVTKGAENLIGGAENLIGGAAKDAGN